MSCNHCGTKFNLFHKELGCANCGLALCSKCLKKKSKVPSKGSDELNVCRTCYKKLQSPQPQSQQEVFEPPDRYLKRLEYLNHPVTVYRENTNVTKLKDGLSLADQEIADRLSKLKERVKAPPSDDEIRERLSKLKGENVSQSPEQTTYYPRETRTDHQLVDSLLEQLGAQQQLEKSQEDTNNFDKSLPPLNGEEYYDNIEESTDFEEEVHNITKKIVSEVSLEERCPLDTFKEVSDDDKSKNSPELPWCVLCNEDAKFRCLDCSGDLYCSTCSVEIHKEWGQTDHRVVPYKKQE